jgi:hypothetical protein
VENDLEIVLTPVQFAAILEGESIEESSALGNRFWGAATVVGGALEMVGGAFLLLAPEPTTITKIAGGALAVHGADTASAGIMQVVSGRTHTTLTSQSVAAAAEALGADPQTAGKDWDDEDRRRRSQGDWGKPRVYCTDLISQTLNGDAMAADAYPRLADLVGGWFHQDYDIEGDTIPEIMGSVLAVTPADQREDLRQEISRFLSEHAEQLDISCGSIPKAVAPQQSAPYQYWLFVLTVGNH